MKILIILLLVIGLACLLAYFMGWKNMGNGAPQVPQKLIAQQSVRDPAPESSPDPAASQPCREIVALMQGGRPIDAQLDWLDGYLAANDTEAAIPAAKMLRANIRTEFLAACVETPDATLGQAAANILAKLRAP